MRHSPTASPTLRNPRRTCVRRHASLASRAARMPAHPALRWSEVKRAPTGSLTRQRNRATHRPVHSSLDCTWGPRAPSGSSLSDCSATACSRCDRIFAMICASLMLAMILSCPPQRAQLSICTPNTRFSRRAQLIATCRGGDGLAGSAPDTGGFAAPRPRCTGVTAARY